MPTIGREVSGDGCGFRSKFRSDSVRISLQQNRVLAAGAHFILVERAVCKAGNEELPEAGRAAIGHGMPTSVPLIEITHHAHATGVWSPDDKMNSRNALDRAHVRTERLVGFEKGPFSKQVQI